MPPDVSKQKMWSTAPMPVPRAERGNLSRLSRWLDMARLGSLRTPLAESGARQESLEHCRTCRKKKGLGADWSRPPRFACQQSESFLAIPSTLSARTDQAIGFAAALFLRRRGPAVPNSTGTWRFEAAAVSPLYFQAGRTWSSCNRTPFLQNHSVRLSFTRAGVPRIVDRRSGHHEGA